MDWSASTQKNLLERYKTANQTGDVYVKIPKEIPIYHWELKAHNWTSHEQSGQTYIKTYEGVLDSPETSATVLERNPEA